LQVILASNSGFCFGVKRAINIAYKTMKNSNTPVYTYGPIIHNPQVVDELKEKGVIPITLAEGIKPGKFIIRSHGAPPSIFSKAKSLGFEIVDATCPFVKRAQQYAKLLQDKGYEIIIVGEINHPEVMSIAEYANGKARVINPEDSFEPMQICEKLGVIAQTTIPVHYFQKVIKSLIPYTEELRVYNTVCEATTLRQKSTLALANKAEVMIVVGGKESANTSRLAQLSRNSGKETYHIETSDELKKTWFKGKSKVGVTAGASTPNWIIKDVIEKIRKL
jgi:small subunit ribosomal protein S1